jgi:hypothetical protein
MKVIFFWSTFLVQCSIQTGLPCPHGTDGRFVKQNYPNLEDVVANMFWIADKCRNKLFKLKDKFKKATKKRLANQELQWNRVRAYSRKVQNIGLRIHANNLPSLEISSHRLQVCNRFIDLIIERIRLMDLIVKKVIAVYFCWNAMGEWVGDSTNTMRECVVDWVIK